LAYPRYTPAYLCYYLFYLLLFPSSHT
jgi:hypothetical protein